MTVGVVLSAVMVGAIIGAWSILTLLGLRPDLAERWRRGR